MKYHKKENLIENIQSEIQIGTPIINEITRQKLNKNNYLL